jgi:hypothetical protein
MRRLLPNALRYSGERLAVADIGEVATSRYTVDHWPCYKHVQSVAQQSYLWHVTIRFSVSLLVRSVADSASAFAAEHSLALVAVASHGPVAGCFVQQAC